jgi:hypothetical protein
VHPLFAVPDSCFWASSPSQATLGVRQPRGAPPIPAVCTPVQLSRSATRSGGWPDVTPPRRCQAFQTTVKDRKWGCDERSTATQGVTLQGNGRCSCTPMPDAVTGDRPSQARPVWKQRRLRGSSRECAATMLVCSNCPSPAINTDSRHPAQPRQCDLSPTTFLSLFLPLCRAAVAKRLTAATVVGCCQRRRLETDTVLIRPTSHRFFFWQCQVALDVEGLPCTAPHTTPTQPTTANASCYSSSLSATVQQSCRVCPFFPLLTVK